MRHSTILAAFAFALAVPAAPALAGDDGDKAEKITDKNHPDYVRCRSESVIGSRAKKNRVCMTNRQWEEMAREGNDVSRRAVEDARSGMQGGG